MSRDSPDREEFDEKKYHSEMKKRYGENKMTMKKLRWFKCLVLHKDDSPCGHEIIHVMGTKNQDYCPVCMEKQEKK